ncbi:S8 family serine peptidase [Actinomadura sp. HBU206391]|uniref:S8 family serine peptidase n=1 Tax=Actinomadura sp. HBU206391 TaxID=2731692 RepID=UPI00165068D9|nr:S8 family serine peptidase [Actinomadura sp. HBU206391]MBC6457981.1 S8 family serine peptidase [Actinomadura sp. HBU206391]
MRLSSRAAAGATLALLMVAATSSPGWASAYPKPLEQQWWFTTWGVQDRLWPITQGQGVTVAVLDSGVQASIPELSGVVLPGTDASSGGGDGRTDVDKSEVPGHGTGMASLIAAQGRGTGFVGVAPRVKILPVVTEGLNGAASAIRYAADHKAKVISVSQAGRAACPSDVQEAVGYAIERDVVIVAAAGNDGDTTNASVFPANCSGVLAVGAVDYRFRPWAKTQRQPYVAVAAPGAQVGSVLRDGEFHPSSGGTSSATALTSAAVALVRSKFRAMPARDVVQRIIASAGDVGAPGKDRQTGYGLIRPYRALTQSAPKNAPNPVFAAYDKWAAANKADAAGRSKADGSKSDTDAPIAWRALTILVIPVVIAILAVVFFGSRSRRRRPAPSGFLQPGGFPRPGGHPTPGDPYPRPGRTPGAPPGAPPHFAPRDGGPRPHGAPPPPQNQNPDRRPDQWDAPGRDQR